MTAIHPKGRITHIDRREAVSRRLSVTSQVIDRLEVALSSAPEAADIPTVSLAPAMPPTQPGDSLTGKRGEQVDPDGVLRAALRSLVGLAYRTPGFDVMISSGPDHHWAVRLSNDGDELRAQLLRNPRLGAAGPVVDLTPSGPRMATELASLLWAGGQDAVEAP